MVWWGRHFDDPAGIFLYAISRSPVENVYDGVNCTFYYAIYSAMVTHSNTSSQVSISIAMDGENIIPAEQASTVAGNPDENSGTPYANAIQQFGQLIASLWPILETSIEYVNSTAQLQPISSSKAISTVLAYSPIFESSFEDPWKMTSNTSTLVSSFMSNISISLLNNLLSTEQNPTTAPYDTTCWYSSASYTYDSERLLVTYGLGIVVAAICMMFGFRAIHLNGMDESLAFSRIVGATLNESLFERRFDLSKSSRVTGEGGVHGRLRLARTSPDETSHRATNGRPLEMRKGIPAWNRQS